MSDTDTEYVLVTEYFHPDTASTGQLMTDLAVGLRERGLDLTVYTGQPNYHSGDNERQPRVSQHEGVEVRRIRAPQLRQSSLPRRLFNWLVFTVWMALALLVADAPTDRDRELLFVSNPPFLPVVLWPVARLRGWSYTYIVYDLYPDQPVELGYLDAGGLPARGWRWLHRKTFHDARRVVALGPRMRDRICRQANPGFDDSKVEIVHNWADPEFVRPQPKSENPFSREHELVEPFTLLYSGNLGEFHDLETVVRAAARLAERYDPTEFRVQIIGEGDAKDSVVSLAERLGVAGGTVRFLPYQDYEVLPDSLTSGDVSVVTVAEGFEGVCVSSKLYTSMAAGTPVLCLAQPGDDEARIVEGYDAGIRVSQGDVDGVVDAVERWMVDDDRVSRQGDNARDAFESSFTAEASIDDYYELLTGSAPQE